jgi:DNA-binding winged helix-turn-helix (wHTH) protein
VWGNRYEGGPRTVDIHVRRLRAKLGETLPLETLRGSGYKLRAPQSDDRARPEEAESDEESPKESREPKLAS